MTAIERNDRPLTGPYWAAVDQGRLIRPFCYSCMRSHFSPQVVCPWCQSDDWDYETSSGLGEVYSHTTIYRPPIPDLTAPYVVADIEMDEGWRLFSWVTGCDPSDVQIGMRVRVSFEPDANGDQLPVFVPANSNT